MDTAQVVEDILEHYGTKGMKWGVRKQYGTSASTSSRSSTKVKGLEHFPKAHTAAMADVAKKMDKAYGLKIDEFVPLNERNTKKGYIAFVSAKGNGKPVINMTTDPKLVPTLNKLNKQGWFVSAPGKTLEANLTHEAAHAMFHQFTVEKTGFMKSNTTPAAMDAMRKSAWDKAKTKALDDGDITPVKGLDRLLPGGTEQKMAKKVSKYAVEAIFTEEVEAEMFAAYHWSPNPPKFVDAFMNDIHGSMGKKVKPFSGRKVA